MDIKFVFKELSEPVYTDDPMYDLMTGGYIEPADMLSKEQAKIVNDAIFIVNSFLSQAEEEGVIEVG